MPFVYACQSVYGWSDDNKSGSSSNGQLFFSRIHKTKFNSPGGGGACKFWSHLGYLGWKVTIPLPFWYHLVLCIKKFTRNAPTLTNQKSPLGVSLSLSHTHIGLPWGFNLNFPTSIPVTFIWGYPGVLINSHINFVFLYFLKGPAPIMGTFLASLARPWRPEGVHLRELPLHKLYY